VGTHQFQNKDREDGADDGGAELYRIGWSDFMFLPFFYFPTLALASISFLVRFYLDFVGFRHVVRPGK
jgi:hypothetical protein